MRSSRLFAVVGFAMATVLGSGVAHANLLTNGSFEDTTNFVDQGNDTMDLDVGSTLMPGWTVTGSHYLSWIGPNNPFGLTASPAGGSYFLDLTGYVTGAPFSGVTQTIATHAGSSYLLTFDLGSSPTYGVQDGVTASAGSASGAFTSTNDGTDYNLWQPESLSFKATGSSTAVTILGNSGAEYIGLDNVSVVETAAIPEPATWAMMLVGFGALGAALRSRRKMAAAAA